MTLIEIHCEQCDELMELDWMDTIDLTKPIICDHCAEEMETEMEVQTC